LIVPSTDPDTILVPSGENATSLIVALWAFVFSAAALMSVSRIIL